MEEELRPEMATFQGKRGSYTTVWAREPKHDGIVSSTAAKKPGKQTPLEEALAAAAHVDVDAALLAPHRTTLEVVKASQQAAMELVEERAAETELLGAEGAGPPRRHNKAVSKAAMIGL